MTAIVGVRCTDGVVIGTDSSATFTQGTFRTIEQPCEKINIVGGKIIVTCTGTVGLAQRFCAIIEQFWNEKKFRGSPIGIGKQLSRAMIQDMQETFLVPKGFGAVVAFPIQKDPYLCEFAEPDFQPELKTAGLWYCSMGSVQYITDSFLALMRKIFWRAGQPRLHDGIFAVAWTLQHAIEVNPGGVNGPPRIAVLEPDGAGGLSARKLEDEELGEHKQNVAGAEEYLRAYRQLSAPEAKIPDVPRPASPG